MFAEATGDRQWIHTDPVRAAAGPFGGPIAHGYLTWPCAGVIAEVSLTSARRAELRGEQGPVPGAGAGRRPVRGVVTWSAPNSDPPGSRRSSPSSSNSRIRPTRLRRRGRRDLPLTQRHALTHSRRPIRYEESTMPEAVIVAAARSPIGRAFKGSLKTCAPTTWPRPSSGPRSTRSRTGPRGHRRPHAGLRAARRRIGVQPGAAWWLSCSDTTTCPAPRSPGTARRHCRPPGWRCTRSGPARATCSSPPGSRR